MSNPLLSAAHSRATASGAAEPLRAPLYTLFCTLFRGIGQIILQRNAASGLLLALAVLSQSARLACALLIGAVTASVLASIVDPHDSPSARLDLNVFNGALASLAAFTFIPDDSQAGAIAIVAAMLATFLAVKLAPRAARAGVPLFSSPAILVTWLWLPLAGHLAGASDAASDAASNAVAATAASSGGAVFAGLAPILFANGVLAGALIAAALAVSGGRVAATALAGSAFGLAAHALCGAPAALLLSGACGFNAALTALATAPAGRGRMLAALMLCVAIERAAAWCGVPALTAPFVLAAWLAWHGRASRPRYERHRT